MPTRCNRGFYCRSYCLLNVFRAPLCPSSGAQEYYTVVAACGISCCGFQVAVLVWSWGCPKHVEQAIRSAIKTSVASSWHFNSTYKRHIFMCKTFTASLLSPSHSNHATKYMNILFCEEYCSGGLHVTFSTAVHVVPSTAQSVQWQGQGLDCLGFECQEARRMFLFSRMYRPALKPNQPPTKWLLVALPPVKGPEQEMDHLPQSSVDVKTVWSYTSTPSTCHHSMHRANFTPADISTGACCPRIMCDISKSNSCKFHGRICLILLERTFWCQFPLFFQNPSFSS